MKQDAEMLKETLLNNKRNRVTDDHFDLNAALEEILNSVGYTTADSGGNVTFYGKISITKYIANCRISRIRIGS